MSTYRILLLDDEDFMVAALRRELLSKPYVGEDVLEIEAFTSPQAALERAGEADGYFDVVIADIRMSEMDGLDFLKVFGELQPHTARIILSGHAGRQELMRAINETHIDFFIAKPWHDYDLKSALWQALRHYDLRCENRRLARLYLERHGQQHQLKRKSIYQLLVVDDDTHVLSALQRELGEYARPGSFGLYQLEVHALECAEEAFRMAQDKPFDVVISDYAMPQMNGIEFLSLLKEVQPDSVRILLSGHADVEVLVEAVNEACVSYFVPKPWRDYELLGAIGRALAHRELELENRILADLLKLERRTLEGRSRVPHPNSR